MPDHLPPVDTTLPDVDKLTSQETLPDPLVAFDGSRVTTASAWHKQRRGELRKLFAHYMYGYAPPAPAAEQVRAHIRRQDDGALDGQATLYGIAIQYGPPGCPPIDMLLAVPNRRQGPAPVFVGMNFRGNHTVLDDPQIALSPHWMRDYFGDGERASDAGRGKQSSAWPLAQIVARGYAVATFYYGDIMPDRPDFGAGVHPHYMRPGQSRPEAHDWGALAAWAWGLSRAIDYLVTREDLDRDRIAVFGHSRLGKAALVCGAYDDRPALVIPNQAGCGGTAPSRCHNPQAETVTRINDTFPHWFNDIFPRFNGRETLLPFDQNCLVALVAPRPVIFTCGTEDQWADPAGQYEVLRAASGVYELLGSEGLSASQQPEVGRLIDSPLGYYLREGPHITDPDYWRVYMDFADRHMK